MQSIPHVVWWMLSGVFLGVSFLHPYFWWCFFPALVLFFRLVKHENSNKQLFLFGFLMGIIHAMGAIFWFLNTVPISFFPNGSLAFQYVVACFYWVLVSLILGISMGFFAILLRYVKGFVYSIPILWVLYELFRAFLFSLMSIGAGGYLNAHFSFGNIGYLLAGHEFFLGFARFGGVYILTFLGVSFVVFMYLAIEKKKYKTACLIACFVLFTYFVQNPFTRQVAQVGVDVVAVETNFDAHFFSTTNNSYKVQLAEIKKATALALLKKPDVVVLPEGAALTDAFDSEAELYEWASTSKAIIVDSMKTEESINAYMRAYVYDLFEEEMYKIDKKYLVPLGEFAPYAQSHIFSKLYSPKIQKTLSEQYAFRIGVLKDDPDYSSRLPAFLFCFESVSPTGVRDALKYRKPPYVVHMVSHAWFYDAHSLEYMLDAMLKVQSVWQEVPILTAANMAENKLYLPDGTIEKGKELESSKYWRLVSFSF